ncbi:MAG: hypothetical protein N4A74_21780 [Carboxylicivirga sp.]|jgi:hypothetical protein|nr:hypothetical protein [Carboxylicivirga sp.]
MKLVYFLLLFVISTSAVGQDKYNYIHFNKLTEVKGTEYVIASIDNRSKTAEARSKYLLFIDTKNGITNQVDFPAEGRINEVRQVKIDEHGINNILVVAKTVDLDGKRGIDWTDPAQIFVLSPDGKSKKQLTKDDYFMRTWTLNHQTGTITVSGYFDTNKNGRFDKKDMNKILIYNLKSLELVAEL